MNNNSVSAEVGVTTCSVCHQQIHTAQLKIGRLASYGITQLECNHSIHTLCIGILQKSYLDNDGYFTCKLPECEKKTDLYSIVGNLPDPGTLEENPNLFIASYLPSYFGSCSEKDHFLSGSVYRALFLESNLSQEETQGLIDKLENTSYRPLIEELLSKRV